MWPSIIIWPGEAPERFKTKSNSRQKFDCGAGILGTSMSSPFWIFEFSVPVLEAIADDPVFVHVLGKHISEKKTKDENKKTPDGEDIDGRGYSCLPFIIFSWFLKRMSCNNFCSWDWSWKAPSDNMPQHFFSISFPNSKYSLNWPLTCQITLKSTNSKLTKYSLLFDRKSAKLFLEDEISNTRKNLEFLEKKSGENFAQENLSK